MPACQCHRFLEYVSAQSACKELFLGVVFCWLLLFLHFGYWVLFICVIREIRIDVVLFYKVNFGFW